MLLLLVALLILPSLLQLLVHAFRCYCGYVSSSSSRPTVVHQYGAGSVPRFVSLSFFSFCLSNLPPSLISLPLTLVSSSIIFPSISVFHSFFLSLLLQVYALPSPMLRDGRVGCLQKYIDLQAGNEVS